MIHRSAALVLALGAALILLVAGCRSQGSPTAAGPVPSAVPAPTPTPAPAPTPTPVAACPLAASTNPGGECGAWGSHLTSFVYNALDATMRDHPELFNFNDLNGGNPKVLDRDKYNNAVQAELATQGVCTHISEDVISVKNTNDYSEDWSIYSSNAYVRRRYMATCAPSWF